MVVILTTMSTTTPDSRITSHNPVVATTDFPAVFPVFDNSDLRVFVDGVERLDFTVTATYTEGVSSNAKVIFSPGITGAVDVVGRRAPRRSNRFGNGGPLPIWAQNLALDTVEAELQETARDVKRSHKAPYGEDGGVFTAADIGNAQGYSAAAGASASAASGSASAASGSASAASGSAAAAAISAGNAAGVVTGATADDTIADTDAIVYLTGTTIKKATFAGLITSLFQATRTIANARFDGATFGLILSTFRLTIAGTLTAARTLTVPDASGTLARIEDADLKAWVNFNGTGTVAIRGSKNVSSITDNGTGDYTVNLTAAVNANAAVVASPGATSAGSFGVNSYLASTTTARLRCFATSTSNPFDPEFFNVSILG